MKRSYLLVSALLHTPILILLSNILSNGKIGIYRVGLLNRRSISPFSFANGEVKPPIEGESEPLVLGGEKDIEELAYKGKGVTPGIKSQEREGHVDAILDSTTNNSVSWIIRPPIGYPKSLVEKGVEGEVVLSAFVYRNGSVIKGIVEKKVDPILDQYAKEWLYSCKIRVLNGEGEQCDGEIKVRLFFRLRRE